MLIKRILLLVGILLWTGLFAEGVRAQAPCCSITAVNAATGVVSAKVNANDETFQFKLTNANLLKEVRVGLGVYANFTTHQVSLDGKSIAGPITSGPMAPAAAPVAPPKAATLPPAAVRTPKLAPEIQPPVSAPPQAKAPANAMPAVGTAVPATGSSPATSSAPPLATPQGAINVFQIVGIAAEVPCGALNPQCTSSEGTSLAPPGSLPPAVSIGTVNYKVDVSMLNLSHATLQNVPVQLSIISQAGGPASTVTQVMTSWAPDDPLSYINAQFSWTAAAGTYTLTATIDPKNQLGIGDDSMSIQLTQPPPVEYLQLNPTDAGPANRIFSFSIQSQGPGTCTGGLVSSSIGVTLTVNLPSPVPFGFGGCTANGTLYKGVKLSNGWKIQNINLTPAHGEYAGNLNMGTISLISSTSLEMLFQSSYSLAAPYPTDTLMTVILEGPLGTAPFQPTVTSPSTTINAPSTTATPLNHLEAIGILHKAK